ncbi:ankyrin [Apiospora rasikravindrae]|uniref:Ankyrin n=1 Tax=Apiospora rasikravindrae TaxID=990691 RepID=A0ABR1RPP9_9PEZI
MAAVDLGGGMLDHLPDELLWEIVDHNHLKDLSKLIRTSKRLHRRLNPYLYRSGMKRDGRPLQYACRKYGRDDIIPRVLSYHEPGEHAAILAHRFQYHYTCSAQNTTPLELAIRHYNLPVVRMLVEQGADLRQSRIFVHVLATPCPVYLDLSLQQPQIQVDIQFEMTKILAKAGADVNEITGNYTPLLLAVKQGSESRFIRLLLETGAYLTGPYSPFSMFLDMHERFTDDLYESAILLAKAARNQNKAAIDSYLLQCLRPHEDERWVDVIEKLLEAGADPQMMVYFLRTHLEWHPSWNHLAKYASPYEQSVRYDRVRKVTVRILHLFAKAGGVTVNDTDHHTPTSLMVAAGLPRQFEELFLDVVQMGGNGHVRVDGATAFHFMFEEPCHALKERIAPLVAIGCPINAKDRDGNTLLHKAALRGMVAESWLPELTKFKFDFLAKNRAGQTFIDILCFKPATPFYPERYDDHMAQDLLQQIDNLKRGGASKPSTSNNRSRPRNRGRGPANKRH